ncbi:hypothetical protein MMA231_04353 (plasmid) [Asticcacaulis sp. MM231]|uniref:glycosyltransferase n=1 Tax=Asticcacaulis sp. MM231 TaxID=3157666 RepID=UPI0032D59DAD
MSRGERDFVKSSDAAPSTREPARRAILVTTGTRGDAAPFVAYAKVLMAEGWDVVLLANSDHAGMAELHGVPFEAVSPPDWPQIGRDGKAFFRTQVIPAYDRVFRFIANEARDRGRPHIFSRTGHWGAQFAAEALDVPFTRIALQPCAIRRYGHPIAFGDLAIINDWRETLGLNRLPFRGFLKERWQNTLSFFPQAYGEPQSRWAQAGDCVGFHYLDDPAEPASDIRTFVEQGRPVVMSLGTGMQDTAVFLRIAENVAKRTDVPVLFLSPFVETEDTRQDGRLLCRKRVDHGYLLPHARLMIHNGGIGAVGQGLRAGIPQVIVPRLYDQPDNARRVLRIGAGVRILPPLFWKGPGLAVFENRLIAQIEHLLGTSSTTTAHASVLDSMSSQRDGA